MNSEICPYTETCIVYKNWMKQTGDNRVNIIFKQIDYSCLALDAHNDPPAEGGILFDKEISERIKTMNVEKNLNLGDVGCSHITLLNKMGNKDGR